MKKRYNRKSKQVDLKSLSVQEVDALSIQIGDKVRKIVDDACEEANKILNGYGMRTKMQIVIEPTNSELTESRRR